MRLERLEGRAQPAGLFPSLDGTGHNDLHSTWGAAGVDLLRRAPSAYTDGASSPAGASRPSARTISNALDAQPADTPLNDRDLSNFIYAWGQFVDHDLDLTSSASPRQSFNIAVPTGDAYFDPNGTGTALIPLSRSKYDAARDTSSMRRSLRRRLQVWYGVVLCGSVVGFAVFLYARASETRWREFDAELLSAAQYLDATLRTFPPRELLGEGPGPRPDRPFPKPGFPPLPPHPPRPPQPSELRLPTMWSPREGGGPRDEACFCVRRANQSVISSSDLPEDLALPEAELLAPGTTPFLVDRGVYREVVMQGPQRTHIVVGHSTTGDRQTLRAFAWQLTTVATIVMGVGLAGGWLVTSLISRPLRTISETASQISADRLHERIPDRDVDEELVSLVGVLNQMFARLEDQGCGIPADCQPHLFERFYRVDTARARSTGGNGLGLAIVRSIVESHGGAISFASTVGVGTTFEVRLPVAG